MRRSPGSRGLLVARHALRITDERAAILDRRRERRHERKCQRCYQHRGERSHVSHVSTRHLPDPEGELWDRFGVRQQHTYVFIDDDGTTRTTGYGRLAAEVEELIAR